MIRVPLNVEFTRLFAKIHISFRIWGVSNYFFNHTYKGTDSFSRQKGDVNQKMLRKAGWSRQIENETSRLPLLRHVVAEAEVGLLLGHDLFAHRIRMAMLRSGRKVHQGKRAFVTLPWALKIESLFWTISTTFEGSIFWECRLFNFKIVTETYLLKLVFKKKQFFCIKILNNIIKSFLTYTFC